MQKNQEIVKVGSQTGALFVIAGRAPRVVGVAKPLRYNMRGIDCRQKVASKTIPHCPHRTNMPFR
jgi:hypothetical protein